MLALLAAVGGGAALAITLQAPAIGALAAMAMAGVGVSLTVVAARRREPLWLAVVIGMAQGCVLLLAVPAALAVPLWRQLSERPSAPEPYDDPFARVRLTPPGPTWRVLSPSEIEELNPEAWSGLVDMRSGTLGLLFVGAGYDRTLESVMEDVRASCVHAGDQATPVTFHGLPAMRTSCAAVEGGVGAGSRLATGVTAHAALQRAARVELQREIFG